MNLFNPRGYSGLAQQPSKDKQFYQSNSLFYNTPLYVSRYQPMYMIREKAGLPKAQLAPFNTTPLHGISTGKTTGPYIPNTPPLFSATPFNRADYIPSYQVKPSLSGIAQIALAGLHELAHDFGKALLPGSKKAHSSAKQPWIRPPGMKNKYQSVSEAKRIPANQSSTIPLVSMPISTTPSVESAYDVEVVEEILNGEENNTMMYLVLGALGFIALGGTAWFVSKKRKPKLKVYSPQQMKMLSTQPIQQVLNPRRK